MKYSFKEVLDSYPKSHIESLWTKYFVRPLSFPVAYVLVNIGCSAWLASVLSILVAIASCVLISIPNSACHWVGISMVVLWQLLDCVDGTIARTTKKTSSLGEFIDAQSGYTIMAFIYFAVGLAAFFDNRFLPNEMEYISIIIGAISSISNVLARLINSRYIYCVLKLKIKNNTLEEIPNEDILPKDILGRIRVLADFHLGLVGIYVPLLIVSELFHLYEFVNIAYCLYSLAGFLFASILYSYKAK